MLAEFQQALADLVARPDLCRRVRRDPRFLRTDYGLTESEYDRLVRVANHKGMACMCMLYRANRLTPLAMNLPDLCRAFGENLLEVLSAYWTKFPNPDAHFLLESARFCRFVESELECGRYCTAVVAESLARESGVINLRLDASESTSESGE